VHPPEHQFLRTHPWVIAGARGLIGGAFNGQPWHDLGEQMPSSDPNALGSATPMDPNVLGHWGICPNALGSHDPNGPQRVGVVGVGTPMYWGGFRVDSPQRVGVDPNSLGHDEGPIPTALVGVF
jgi:hypothetical protein